LCATSEVDSSSTNLSQGAIDLSNMSASQSASVEQISATIEEATENIASNFENMKYLKTIGLEAQKKADTGYSHMKELSKSMQDITDSSQEINTLVNTIDEITFQTNLLALNAAVEAARAGEHGLGFAVVSEEVRSLATRSADESTKIRKVIEKSVEYTQIGDNISKDTTLSFQEILKTIEDTISVISQVTQGSQEQKLAIEELKRAIDSVDGVTQSLSASSEQIAASSQELSEQTNSTKQIVNNLVNMV
jgi:methyl-accepting chemotaxis protein